MDAKRDDDLFHSPVTDESGTVARERANELAESTAASNFRQLAYKARLWDAAKLCLQDVINACTSITMDSANEASTSVTSAPRIVKVDKSVQTEEGPDGRPISVSLRRQSSPTTGKSAPSLSARDVTAAAALQKQKERDELLAKLYKAVNSPYLTFSAKDMKQSAAVSASVTRESARASASAPAPPATSAPLLPRMPFSLQTAPGPLQRSQPLQAGTGGLPPRPSTVVPPVQPRPRDPVPLNVVHANTAAPSVLSPILPQSAPLLSRPERPEDPRRARLMKVKLEKEREEMARRAQESRAAPEAAAPAPNAVPAAATIAGPSSQPYNWQKATVPVSQPAKLPTEPGRTLVNGHGTYTPQASTSRSPALPPPVPAEEPEPASEAPQPRYDFPSLLSLVPDYLRPKKKTPTATSAEVNAEAAGSTAKEGVTESAAVQEVQNIITETSATTSAAVPAQVTVNGAEDNLGDTSMQDADGGDSTIVPVADDSSLAAEGSSYEYLFDEGVPPPSAPPEASSRVPQQQSSAVSEAGKRAMFAKRTAKLPPRPTGPVAAIHRASGPIAIPSKQAREIDRQRAAEIAKQVGEDEKAKFEKALERSRNAVFSSFLAPTGNSEELELDTPMESNEFMASINAHGIVYETMLDTDDEETRVEQPPRESSSPIASSSARTLEDIPPQSISKSDGKKRARDESTSPNAHSRKRQTGAAEVSPPPIPHAAINGAVFNMPRRKKMIPVVVVRTKKYPSGQEPVVADNMDEDVPRPTSQQASSQPILHSQPPNDHQNLSKPVRKATTPHNDDPTSSRQASQSVIIDISDSEAGSDEEAAPLADASSRTSTRPVIEGGSSTLLPAAEGEEADAGRTHGARHRPPRLQTAWMTD